MSAERFHVEPVDFHAAREALHEVRGIVFIQGQNVPAEIERDELDPQCLHVLARSDDGAPIGTGRLTPQRKIGRMAVLESWRGRGVGDALLRALVELARDQRWAAVSLHSQVSAIGFYARHGFLPAGPRFMEAGIEHQTMTLTLIGPAAVDTREQAVVATLSAIADARRTVRIYSRELDPGLLDVPEVLAACRRFAVRGGELRILLQDAEAPRRRLAPLINLSQRLPTAFAFRTVDDPVDHAYPSAFIASDMATWYFRPLGHSVEGEMQMQGAARARELARAFDPVWERSRQCTEFRALGI